MLTDHFRDPRTLDRIQSTVAAPYLDVFADALTKAGYKWTTIQRYLGAVAHLSFWQQSRARLLTELDGSNVGEFKQHLLACKCVGFQWVNEPDARGSCPNYYAEWKTASDQQFLAWGRPTPRNNEQH